MAASNAQARLVRLATASVAALFFLLTLPSLLLIQGIVATGLRAGAHELRVTSAQWAFGLAWSAVAALLAAALFVAARRLLLRRRDWGTSFLLWAAFGLVAMIGVVLTLSLSIGGWAGEAARVRIIASAVLAAVTLGPAALPCAGALGVLFQYLLRKHVPET